MVKAAENTGTTNAKNAAREAKKEAKDEAKAQMAEARVTCYLAAQASDVIRHRSACGRVPGHAGFWSADAAPRTTRIASPHFHTGGLFTRCLYR